jgi:predicted transcriptional regulator
MKKLTKDQIEEIKKLKSMGISSYEIAEKFKISQSAVCYHLRENKRTDKIKDFQREYHKKRYQTDEVFKLKQIAATIKSRKNLSKLKKGNKDLNKEVSLS